MLWTDRKKPASGAAGLLAKARTDYQRLLATLYGLGRYGGTILSWSPGARPPACRRMPNCPIPRR